MAKKNPLSVGFKDFEISARFAGAKSAACGANSRDRHYVVTVRGVNNRSYRARFDFWTSQADPVMKTPAGVMDALRCFVDDAVSGRDYYTSYHDFCRVYGYDAFDAAKQARAAWRGCRAAYDKWRRLTGADACEVCEALEALDAA